MKIYTFVSAVTLLTGIAAVACSAPRYSIIDAGPEVSLLGFTRQGEILAHDTQGNLVTYKDGVLTNVDIPAATSNACYQSFPPIPGPYAVAINDEGDIAYVMFEYFASNDVTPACLILNRKGTFTITNYAVVSNLAGIDGTDRIIYDSSKPITQGGGATCVPASVPGISGWVPGYFGVNNNGTIVGSLFAYIGRTANNPGAMICRDGRAHLYEDIGSESSQATAVNDFAVATGFIVSNTGVQHAALFEEHRTIDIDARSSEAVTYSYGTSINDFREVVGTAEFSPTDFGPFLYYGHHMYELQALIDEHDPLRKRIQISGNAFINNSGDIAVGGNDSRTGEGHIYILHPRDMKYRDE